MNRISKTNVAAMTRAALFAGIFTIMAQIYFPLPFTPVPVTLQTLGIMLCAVVLSPFEAVLSVLLYVLMGTVGLPVFAGFSGGPSRLVGPTGGFILGWLPAVWLMSRMVRTGSMSNMGNTSKDGAGRNFSEYVRLFAAMLIFNVVMYASGLSWFMFSMNASLDQAFLATTLPFLPGDLVKTGIVALMYPIISRRLISAK